MNNINNKSLFNTVVKGGYCIGCGTCTLMANNKAHITLNKYSMFELSFLDKISDNEDIKMKSVCPFSDNGYNEDILSKDLYDNLPFYNRKIGYYTSLYAGYVKKNDYRERGSSGGFGSWIISKLLEKKEIDKVVHVKNRIPTKDDCRVFSYQISNTIDEIESGAKSKYYPIELSEILDYIKNNPSKYLIVGVPCFIKSVRLLMKQSKIFEERIKFCVGLVCGHLKSTRFADLFAWQNGIHPNNLYAIDFRTKLPSYGANNYGVTITSHIGDIIETVVSKPINQQYGSNWGKGFFKYKACDFCDDVLAETADITIGDAWLPQYVTDSEGTNIIVVRNRDIDQIVKDSIVSEEVFVDTLDEDSIIKSQQGGFTHRHDDLAYRLLLVDKRGEWRPHKRILPASNISSKRKEIQNLRTILSKDSHIAFKEALNENNFNEFKAHMRPIEKRYDKLYRGSFWVRCLRKIKRIFISLK